MCAQESQTQARKTKLKFGSVRIFKPEWKNAKPSHHLEQSIICLHFQPLPPDLLLKVWPQGASVSLNSRTVWRALNGIYLHMKLQQALHADIEK